MNLYDVSEQLTDLLESNRTVLLKTEPEAPDFTSDTPFKVVIWGAGTGMQFDVEPKEVLELISLFDATIFDKSVVDRLFCWNLKSLASYFHFHTKKLFKPATSVFDLKPIEGFLGIRQRAPENLTDALHRMKSALKHKGWQSLYKSVHLPLSLRVLPSIETTPLLNEELKRPEYPYYEIEGQSNGRMNCSKRFSKSYLPHNMGPDVKKVMKPRGIGYRFMYSDFHYCEVAVLQWLSKDPVLGEMLSNGEDLYKQFYELITGDTCDTEVKRKKGKLTLLAVIYGSGAKGLAKGISVPDAVAAELIRRIEVKLPTAMNWLAEQQEKAKGGEILDYFGRPRTFPEDQAYLARNFVIQGVAATVCQEKLIDLHDALDGENAYLAFSLHDGQGTIVKVAKAREAYKLVKSVTESESKLCPGLNMKVEIKFGAKLDSMKVLWKD